MLEKDDFLELEQMMRRIAEEHSREAVCKETADIKAELWKEFYKEIQNIKSRLKKELTDMEKDFEKRMEDKINASEELMFSEMKRYYSMTKSEVKELKAKAEKRS